jgi:glycosyltransferase involved in cell wall biosynthesis
LLSEIWPEIVKVNSDAKLWVAGRVCESWEGDWPTGATPLGFVPNLADLYSRASVSLAPIRFGSGLKIKVMEALEYCVPVVATSAAAIGFEDAPSSLVRIADDTAAFIDEITNALGEQTPEDLHASLRNYTARKFPSELVGQRVARALLEVVQKRASMQHQFMSDKRQIAR